MNYSGGSNSERSKTEPFYVLIWNGSVFEWSEPCLALAMNGPFKTELFHSSLGRFIYIVGC